MKRLAFIACLFSYVWAYSQNTFQAIIKDGHTEEPLIGATAILEGTENGTSADVKGLAILQNIPNGKQNIIFSFVGYETHKETFEFPLSNDQPVLMLLEGGEEMEEVVVSATRSSRTIDEVPTRIEVLSAEELGEKAVMNSTNIAMLLRESTGIQIQQPPPIPLIKAFAFRVLTVGIRRYSKMASPYLVVLQVG